MVYTYISNMENLSVIIPVYNEENSIEKTLTFFGNFLKENPGAEAIFVNDASTDRTGRILSASAGSDRLKLLTHARNEGYGASLKDGIRHAAFDRIAIMDADGSYPPETIAELHEKMLAETADMAVGERKGRLSGAGIIRGLARFILRKFAEYLSESTIPDLNSGLRIFKKSSALKFLNLLPDRFSFTTTLTLSLLADRQKVIYVPVEYRKRKGRSKIRPIKDTADFLQLIVRTTVFFNPIKVFFPLGSFFIVLSIAVLIITWLAGRVMDITTIILFTTGMNFLAIGLLADLIDKRLKG